MMETEMKWISVKDRLPEVSREYIVWTVGAEEPMVGLAGFESDTNKWDILFHGIEVTHWMPLPPAPGISREEENHGKGHTDNCVLRIANNCWHYSPRWTGTPCEKGEECDYKRGVRYVCSSDCPHYKYDEERQK